MSELGQQLNSTCVLGLSALEPVSDLASRLQPMGQPRARCLEITVGMAAAVRQLDRRLGSVGGEAGSEDVAEITHEVLSLISR